MSRRLAPALSLVAVLAIGCAVKRSRVVLLRDDGGTVGQVEVSNRFGAVDLVEARSTTLVPSNGPPGPVTVLGDEEVTRRFGSTLDFLPAPPHRFTVYFEFDSDVLTDESRRLIPTILTTVKDRGAREVTIVGHTDSMGDKPDNFALGLKRAATVRDLLLAAGLDKSLVDVTSLGESDPLVPTANGKAEPQNRRVEIVVYPRQQ